MTIKSDFETAALEVKKLTEAPSSEEKLNLYGLYKVANGESFENAKSPGRFDFEGKAKYKAWEAAHKKSLSAEAAQTQYIKEVAVLKPKYKYDPNKKV